jgi:hypothetical protein
MGGLPVMRAKTEQNKITRTSMYEYNITEILEGRVKGKVISVQAVDVLRVARG